MEQKVEEVKTSLRERPPVVAVLGHVDHGKTTLLDAIRKTRVAEKAARSRGEPRPVAGREAGPPRLARIRSIVEGEAGGITQHIGAYEIIHAPHESPAEGRKITFIDTPGHEAFSAMRSRGAHVADIAILVVAADEGVKPQTKEAYEHIQKAEIPFLVAFTKMDKAENSEKAKGELAELGITVESWGGKVPSVDVSATTGRGMQELLDLILLQAEVEELKTDPDALPAGVVIEAHMDPRRGKTATLVVLDGRLRRGEALELGDTKERIKILENDLGKPIEEAAASMPVRVSGLESLPAIGTVFGNLPLSIPTLQREIMTPSPSEETPPALRPIIVKADVAGSLEAVTQAIDRMDAWDILSSGVGEITESDVKLAASAAAAEASLAPKGRAAPAKTLVVGFRVTAAPAIARLAENLHVEILTKDVIYELLEELERRAKPEEKAAPTTLGEVSIIALFRQDGNRQIVGGKVTEGELKAGMTLDVWRAEEKLGTGKVRELREGKETKETVTKGRECGILFDGSPQIAIGDTLRAISE